MSTGNRDKHDRGRKNASGFKGVSYRKDKGDWKAAICVNYKVTHLGIFNTPEEAHAAYRKAYSELNREKVEVVRMETQADKRFLVKRADDESHASEKWVGANSREEASLEGAIALGVNELEEVRVLMEFMSGEYYV